MMDQRLKRDSTQLFTGANRFVQVKTVTNVPGFLTGFITSHQSDQTCVMSQYLSKSGGAPPHSTTQANLAFRMTATFWSAAVFCRF
jgi:lysozyme family protein